MEWILEARRKEALYQARLEKWRARYLQQTPQALLSVLTTEDVRGVLLPRWTRAVAGDLSHGVEAEQFVGIVFEVLATVLGPQRVLGDSATREVLRTMYTDVDAAHEHCVSWDVFAAYLVDTAPFALPPPLPAPDVELEGGEAQAAAAAATAAALTPPEVVTLHKEPPRRRQLNALGSSMDVVVAVKPLLPLPMAAAITRTGVLRVIRTDTFDVVGTARLGAFATVMAFAPQRRLVKAVPGIFAVRSYVAVFTATMRLAVVPMRGFDVRGAISVPDMLTDLVFSPADECLYGSTARGNLFVFSVDIQGQPALVRQLQVCGDHINSLIPLPNGHRLAVATSSPQLRVAELRLEGVFGETRAQQQGRFLQELRRHKKERPGDAEGPAAEDAPPTASQPADGAERRKARDAEFLDLVLRPRGPAADKTGLAVTPYTGASCSAMLLSFAEQPGILCAALADYTVACFVDGCPSVPAFILRHVTQPHAAPIIGLGVDSKQAHLVSADRAGHTKLWDLGQLACIGSHSSLTSRTSSVVCAAVLSETDQVLLNSNRHMHTLRVDHATQERADGSLLRDQGDPVVLLQQSPKDPTRLYVVASTGIVHWDIPAEAAAAAFPSPYTVTSAACVDDTGSRVYLGSAAGELSAVRFDNARPLRDYSLPRGHGEVVSVAFAASPRVVVALLEEGRLVVVRDGGQGDGSVCPPERVLPISGGLRQLLSLRHIDAYLALDAQQRPRVFAYDPAESIVRLHPETSILAVDHSGDETTACIGLGSLAACACSTTGGHIAIFALKPHAMAGSCIARWANNPQGTEVSGAGWDSGGWSPVQTDPPSDFGDSSPVADCVGSASPAQRRGPPATHLLFVPPHTLISADDARRLVQWDIADVLLQAKLLSPGCITKVVLAGLKRGRQGLLFHSVPRPPVVRCLAVSPIGGLPQALTFLQPNCVCVCTMLGRPCFFVITPAGLRPAKVSRPSGPTRPSSTARPRELPSPRLDSGASSPREEIITFGDAPIKAVANPSVPAFSMRLGPSGTWSPATSPRVVAAADESSAEVQWLPPTSARGGHTPVAADLLASQGQARLAPPGDLSAARLRWRRGYLKLRTCWLLFKHRPGREGHEVLSRHTTAGALRGTTATERVFTTPDAIVYGTGHAGPSATAVAVGEDLARGTAPPAIAIPMNPLSVSPGPSSRRATAVVPDRGTLFVPGATRSMLPSPAGSPAHRLQKPDTPPRVPPTVTGLTRPRGVVVSSMVRPSSAGPVDGPVDGTWSAFAPKPVRMTETKRQVIRAARLIERRHPQCLMANTGHIVEAPGAPGEDGSTSDHEREYLRRQGEEQRSSRVEGGGLASPEAFLAAFDGVRRSHRNVTPSVAKTRPPPRAPPLTPGELRHLGGAPVRPFRPGASPGPHRPQSAGVGPLRPPTRPSSAASVTRGSVPLGRLRAAPVAGPTMRVLSNGGAHGR